jgi:hypothetical protein
MLIRGRLVDKVRILALLIAAPFLVISCGGKEAATPDPDRFIAAADSASLAIEGKLAILRDTANRPSPFFDTLYSYYAAARRLEVEKRLDADSISRAAVLAVDNVKDAALRQRGISTLNAFLGRDSLRLVRREQLRGALKGSLTVMLDSAALPPKERPGVISELTALSRFEPDYRRELDSLTQNTILVELEILELMNSAGSRIKVEEVLKFADANDLARYQMLTTRLGELAAAQQLLVDRITYGVGASEDSLASATAKISQDTAGAQPAPRPPVQSWPDAVRIQ